MIISIIVATAKNQVIGKDNDIPWYLPADLKYFKQTTLGHHIIMGRNCYESIGRPLPKRTNIVLTRNPFLAISNCLVTHSIEEALAIAAENGETEAFIIGGGEIYKQSMPYADRVYLTEVDLEVDGDIFFPVLDAEVWKEVSQEAHKAAGKNEYDYTFKIYDRIKEEA